MKRHVLLLTVMLAVPLAAEAAEVVDSPKEYLIPRVERIVIDGKLADWAATVPQYAISPESKDAMISRHIGDPTNPPKGDADVSGKVALAWDEKHLYVAASMVDDHLMGIKPGSHGNQGPAGWFCDSVMIAVASYRQHMKTNSPYQRTPLIGLRYAPAGPKSRGQLIKATEAVLNKRTLYWVLTRNAKMALVETAKGYDVEAAIPWADLGFVARPGERLFIAFLVPDVDPGEALNQVGWGYDGDPKQQPAFRLADGDGLTGMLTVSADEVALNRDWGVRAELDARKRVATLESVRVMDAAGKEVTSEAIRLDVPTGKTGRAVVDFKAGLVAKPGVYTVEALAKVGGRTAVIARHPLRIVEAEAAPPMIKNPPGEVHHMSPERVYHHANSQHRRKWYRYNFVKGKEGYVPYIRKWVEPNLKGAARTLIQQRYPYGYHQALRCIALYRITGDKEYIELARGIMDYMLDEAAGKPKWFQFTAIAMYRYLTWMKDPKSPFAPKDAEKRYREGLHLIAAKPQQIMFNESGTHNRVWHYYAEMKVARMVAEEDKQPIDPRVIEFTDYHDKLIGAVGDSDDAAPGYHWVFMDAAFGIYFHTGDWKAFVKHPGYTKSFDRYVEMVTPSGACPQFASTSGWHDIGESMWAYEWMSTLTRNGRYRWTSHRMAEYYYNHLNWIANQYHGPFDTALNNFVLAYILADDTVTPKAPPPTSRVTWRHPLVKVPLERRRQRPGTSPYELGSDSWIPDKVILSSGNDPKALFGMVNLLPIAGHGGEVPGNIVVLMQYDAGLLIGQGYYENVPSFQNLLWVEDLDGLAADPTPLQTTVPIFVDDPALTFVRIKTTSYQHLPVTYTRDILFYKNGFMVVKDRAKFDTTMKVRLGPCYQTSALGPECGPNWFNMYYEQLYHTGLGLGGGVQSMKNPAWDVLLYFTPRKDRKHTVVDRYKENPYRCSPVQVRQSWAGMARAGQEITFTSILLPHAPSQTPSQFVTPPADSDSPKRIEVVVDEDNLTVVKVIYELDPMNKLRNETWVMLNDTGKMAKAGPLESDGHIAVVGHSHDGSIQHRVLVGGKTLIYRGVDESAKARTRPVAPLAMPKEYKEWKRP